MNRLTGIVLASLAAMFATGMMSPKNAQAQVSETEAVAYVAAGLEISADGLGSVAEQGYFIQDQVNQSAASGTADLYLNNTGGFPAVIFQYQLDNEPTTVVVHGEPAQTVAQGSALEQQVVEEFGGFFITSGPVDTTQELDPVITSLRAALDMVPTSSYSWGDIKAMYHTD